MMRTFRLTNEPGGMGLSCTPAGVSLAGVPLLRKTEAGFVPRSAAEIAALVEAAYGASDEPVLLQSRLGAIAEALNRGDLARASIAAVLTRTPELSWKAAARLAKVDLSLSKYDPDQPRDWHGRWTSGDAADPKSPTMPVGDSAAHEEVKPVTQLASNLEQRGNSLTSLSPPIASDASGHAVSDDDAHDDSPDPTSPTYEFEQKYDDLGPVEFAKRVIEFGDWLGRNRDNLSPADKAHALAEYSFLQDRLSFWLSYDYTPAAAHLNLLSAALTLYQGAVVGGLVGPRNMPASMLDVAGGAWALDGAPPNIRPATAKPKVDYEPFEHAPAESGASIKEIEGLGGVVSNSETRITWGKGIQDQDGGWAPYIARQDPGARLLNKGSTGFDVAKDVTGEAISAKTLDTLTVSRIKRPQQLLSKLKVYIHAAENYRPRREGDLDLGEIRSKTIQLAIPRHTSPAQWRYLNLGIGYAREHGISVAITRIGE